MKKSFLLLFMAIALMVSGNVEAQVKSNVLKTSLVAPIIKTYTLAYERALNTDMSVQLGFNYFAGWKFGDRRLNGFSIIPEYRYYLSEAKEAPNGPYVAPFMRFGSTGIEEGEVGDEDYGKATINIIGGGLLIGSQRTFKDVLSLEAFVGPAYYNAKLDVESGVDEGFNLNLIDGWSVRLGVTVGIVF
jgi:hypothetical protein